MSRPVPGDIPSRPGSYALYLALPQAVRLAVGRLCAWDFPAGDYLYLGSAQGPGGLRARLAHHTRLAERPHWHLDWLRPHAQVLGGWYASGTENLECLWSQALLSLPGVLIPCPGFGASDCRQGCQAHLLAFLAGLPLELVQAELLRIGPQTVPWRAQTLVLKKLA